MLVGDASYLEEAMLSGTIDGVSPDESVSKATLRTLRRITESQSSGRASD
jgi:hypothetical protein